MSGIKPLQDRIQTYQEQQERVLAQSKKFKKIFKKQIEHGEMFIKNESYKKQTDEKKKDFRALSPYQMAKPLESYASHSCEACEYLKNMGKTKEELERERLQELMRLHQIFHTCESIMPKRPGEEQLPQTMARMIRLSSPGKVQREKSQFDASTIKILKDSGKKLPASMRKSKSTTNQNKNQMTRLRIKGDTANTHIRNQIINHEALAGSLTERKQRKVQEKKRNKNSHSNSQLFKSGGSKSNTSKADQNKMVFMSKFSTFSETYQTPFSRKTNEDILKNNQSHALADIVEKQQSVLASSGRSAILLDPFNKLPKARKMIGAKYEHTSPIKTERLR